ncbi:MAG: hypothetical protein EU544_00320 [Promethearchaeota archaeon]|nr:MAG: hypothetical protein EU544_00320 [Candidatus Lokiarchaeota archaeon]
MSSDKISKLLEKQLKTIGQELRIDILKKLDHFDRPISFSKLQKEVLGDNPNSTNFSFHLKTLKEAEVVYLNSKGYQLTQLGKKLLNVVLSFERELIDEHKTLMIRTSKYSKEPFNIKKIEEYLIHEGEVEEFLAKQISKEVRKRLSQTNIQYLTAPLMREYINGVLIEMDLENVRKKLTRLGTPPCEVHKLFNGLSSSPISPEHFIRILGSDVSEQFLLLNLLPGNLADLYLSGEIALLHLNYWSLRPLSIYLTTESLLNLIEQRFSLKPQNLSRSAEYFQLIAHFFEITNGLSKFFSQDLLLGGFNRHFLSIFSGGDQQEQTDYFNFILSFLEHSFFSKTFSPYLSLEFQSLEGAQEVNDSSWLFLEQMSTPDSVRAFPTNPNIFLNADLIRNLDIEWERFNTLFSSHLLDNTIFYGQKRSHLLNSTLIRVKDPQQNRLILDKIFINLPLLAIKANQNDGLFFELLQDKLAAVLKLFKYKALLVQKKLKGVAAWQKMAGSLFTDSPTEALESAIRSISFLGLNKAVKIHCGIELDRLQTSEKFALQILRTLNEHIREENAQASDLYELSQPHYGLFLNQLWDDNIYTSDQKEEHFSSRIIRKASHIHLDKRISLFRKFAKFLGGGTVFHGIYESNTLPKDELLSILAQADLGAFTLSNKLL